MTAAATQEDNKVCSECQATKTYSNWRRTENGEGWLCKKCYMRNYLRKHPQVEKNRERVRKYDREHKEEEEGAPKEMTITTDKAKIIRFIIQNKGLSRLLKVIGDNEGITTADLIHELRMSTHAYVLLNQAEEEGYIKREKEEVDGRGNYRIRNYLTDKGRVVANVMKELGL